MKKLMFNNEVVADFEDLENKYKKEEVDKKLNDLKEEVNTNKMTSATVKRVEVVTEYPAVEERDVLYVKLES